MSAIGPGNCFIRVGVANTICDRIKRVGEDAGEAAEFALADVTPHAGDGGVIVMDGAGAAQLTFNSAGMYRGAIDAEGSSVAIL